MTESNEGREIERGYLVELLRKREGQGRELGFLFDERE